MVLLGDRDGQPLSRRTDLAPATECRTIHSFSLKDATNPCLHGNRKRLTPSPSAFLQPGLGGGSLPWLIWVQLGELPCRDWSSARPLFYAASNGAFPASQTFAWQTRPRL